MTTRLLTVGYVVLFVQLISFIYLTWYGGGGEEPARSRNSSKGRKSGGSVSRKQASRHQCMCCWLRGYIQRT